MDLKEVINDLKQNELINDLYKRNQQQADRIVELEKENKALHELVKQRIARNVELQNLLSTPQTKPLSDEEIQQAIDKIDWNQSNVLIRFARALEERLTR